MLVQVSHSSTFNQTDSPSGYTFSTTIRMLAFDAILWSIVAWYLNRVVPSEYGTPLRWYFPFTPSYWCPGTAKAPRDDGDETIDETDPSIPIEPVSNALKQQDEEGKSVQIKNLRKAYGEKLAVDGLSLSMYSGQVTALLGHNGAGKTTTIGMLTGMVKPTSGYALVAGNDIRTQMNQIRQECGICLQHDCLFPQLTVKEHIQFFARIKGLYAKMSHEEAEKSVMTSIEDVALIGKEKHVLKELEWWYETKAELLRLRSVVIARLYYWMNRPLVWTLFRDASLGMLFGSIERTAASFLRRISWTRLVRPL